MMKRQQLLPIVAVILAATAANESFAAASGFGKLGPLLRTGLRTPAVRPTMPGGMQSAPGRTCLRSFSQRAYNTGAGAGSGAGQQAGRVLLGLGGAAGAYGAYDYLNTREGRLLKQAYAAENDDTQRQKDNEIADANVRIRQLIDKLASEDDPWSTSAFEIRAVASGLENLTDFASDEDFVNIVDAKDKVNFIKILHRNLRVYKARERNARVYAKKDSKLYEDELDASDIVDLERVYANFYRRYMQLESAKLSPAEAADIWVDMVNRTGISGFPFAVGAVAATSAISYYYPKAGACVGVLGSLPALAGACVGLESAEQSAKDAKALAIALEKNPSLLTGMVGELATAFHYGVISAYEVERVIQIGERVHPSALTSLGELYNEDSGFREFIDRPGDVYSSRLEQPFASDTAREIAEKADNLKRVQK